LCLGFDDGNFSSFSVVFFFFGFFAFSVVEGGFSIGFGIGSCIWIVGVGGFSSKLILSARCGSYFLFFRTGSSFSLSSLPLSVTPSGNSPPHVTLIVGYKSSSISSAVVVSDFFDDFFPLLDDPPSALDFFFKRRFSSSIFDWRYNWSESDNCKFAGIVPLDVTVCERSVVVEIVGDASVYD
jgi:hypothetical protein